MVFVGGPPLRVGRSIGRLGCDTRDGYAVLGDDDRLALLGRRDQARDVLVGFAHRHLSPCRLRSTLQPRAASSTDTNLEPEDAQPVASPDTRRTLVVDTKWSHPMSRAISASEANQNFSKLLREVGRGETFVVMSRGRAVAKVVPVDAPDAAQPVDELLSWLDALPRRDAGRWTRDDLYP